ncbi:MAG TPA: hypothetical protein VGF17_09590 [Phytomonospora sp.]
MSRSDARAGCLIVAAVIGFVLFIILLATGVWWFQVATSDVKGRGESVIVKNSATNRIAAQERFEDLYQEVVTADQRLDVLAAAAKADPNSQVAATNYTGAVAYCIDVRGDYNAEARKYTSADFRAIDLPNQIDPLNSDTDCQENLR